ncbi:MAG TPA: AI-2E family transporter [Bryobacteraceae bacterium]|nr:AI-2E family transporter [Bryobacteraceae bacterium]
MYAPGTTVPSSYRVGVGVLASAATVALLYYGRVFLITVMIAVIIAFLLEPAVQMFMKLRLPRGLASFLVCSIALAFLYLSGLGAYTESLAMIGDLPVYSERVNEIVDAASTRAERFENNLYQTLVPKKFQNGANAVPEAAAVQGRGKKKSEPALPPPIPQVRVLQEPTSLVNYVYDYLRSFYDVLLMASFVPFLVYFILSWGDHLRSRLLFTLEGDSRYTVSKALDGVGDMVRAYVIGNFLLGVVLSIASAILFASVKLPYWLVVGPMSGFLSLIPYIGLPLALAPPLLAAVAVTSQPAMYLFLASSVALLHLLALNLLYPKFVGARVHLNPLMVTVALMFWGTLWGGIGLLLAIPITAAIKAVCDNVSGLQSYGRLLGD